MAKITMFGGMASGKVGGVVYAIRNGQQIARAYNPYPSKSSTDAQVQSRAKLKLMSQLSQILSPAIAMRREGSRSPRNRFVSKNYGAATYQNDIASVNLAGIQLTDSVVGLPQLTASMNGGSVTVGLGTPDLAIRSMVYVFLQKGNDNALRFVTSRVINDAGEGALFSTTVSLFSARETVVLAYGIQYIDEKQVYRYGGLQAVIAEDIAKLMVSSSAISEAIQLTETNGIKVSPSA